jgi:hypothetical protein
VAPEIVPAPMRVVGWRVKSMRQLAYLRFAAIARESLRRAPSGTGALRLCLFDQRDEFFRCCVELSLVVRGDNVRNDVEATICDMPERACRCCRTPAEGWAIRVVAKARIPFVFATVALRASACGLAAGYPWMLNGGAALRCGRHDDHASGKSNSQNRHSIGALSGRRNNRDPSGPASRAP